MFIKRIYFWYAVLIFIVVFLLFFPLLLPTLYIPKLQTWAQRIRKTAVRIFMVFTGLYYKVENRHYLKNLPQFLACANHASHLDNLLITASIPGFYRFLAKAELMKIPLFGLFFKTLDIPVERATAQGAKKALIRAEACVKAGDNLIFYPEGGIKEGSPQLQTFKNGAFILAHHYNIPIVPITLLKTWERLPDLATYATPGKMRVIIHKPIVPNSQQSSIEELKTQVFNTIQKPLKTYLETQNVK